MKNALTKSIPGRSKNDQLRDRVTKMRAWLTILTCRYKAAIISSGLFLIDLTPNLSCNGTIHEQDNMLEKLQEQFCENNFRQKKTQKKHHLTGKKSVSFITQKKTTVINPK